MKISLGSWAFSFGPFADNPIPFEKTVQRMSEAGYDGIEVCGFPPHVTLERYPTPQSRKDLVNYLGSNGLGVSGYAADFTTVNPVTPGNREPYLELFRSNLEMCVEIGSPNIRVDTVAAPGSIDERDYQASFDRVADLWREAARLAQDAGVRMVWEFEPGFAFNKPSEILSMHQQVAHPNFRLLFDTSHAYMCGVVGARQHGPRERILGGVPDFLRKLRGRIGAIHLIDSDGTLHGDETSTHRPFGEGFIDFGALAPLLLEVPDIEWWCIDMCFWAGSWELVESSLAYVRNLVRGKVVAG
jgi:sugar phosphate isomerase/epimerase